MIMINFLFNCLEISEIAFYGCGSYLIKYSYTNNLKFVFGQIKKVPVMKIKIFE